MKPILFSTEMVQAILAERKTQTRRVIKEAIGWDNNWMVSPIKEKSKDGIQRYEMRSGSSYGLPYFKCPYGSPGDILWVRETWRAVEQDFGSPRYEYKATETIDLKTKWKPSIFMPKEACRLFLKIKSLRIERLQDITEEDAIAEGVLLNQSKRFFKHAHIFEELWATINGKESWDANPWVWVIEFERCEKPPQLH